MGASNMKDVCMIFARLGISSSYAIDDLYSRWSKDSSVPFEEWIQDNLFPKRVLESICHNKPVAHVFEVNHITTLEERCYCIERMFRQDLRFYERHYYEVSHNYEIYINELAGKLSASIQTGVPHRFNTPLSKVLYALYLDYPNSEVYDTSIIVRDATSELLYEGPASGIPDEVTSQNWTLISLEPIDRSDYSSTPVITVTRRYK